MKSLLFFVPAFLPSGAQVWCPYGPGIFREGGYMMHYGFGGVFMWLIFMIVLGVAVYFIVKSSKTGEASGQAQENALDILKKRYAKGEITKEDFDRIKKDVE